MINFRTEGGYGFGKDVPRFSFSAKYSGTYVPDFPVTLCFSVRGDNYVLKVNNKKIGEYVPKELSFKYTPGMNLTSATPEVHRVDEGQTWFIYTLPSKEGQKLIRLLLIINLVKKGVSPHLSVDMYERSSGDEN